MEVAILIGLQGAGKSTFYARRLAATHALTSKDLMKNSRDRTARQAREIAAALAEGRSIAVDNTSPTPVERAPLVALAKAHGARAVAYFFVPDLAACLRRNAQREGRARVRDGVVVVTARRLVVPTAAEGFAAIYEVRVAGDDFAVSPG